MIFDDKVRFRIMCCFFTVVCGDLVVLGDLGNEEGKRGTRRVKVFKTDCVCWLTFSTYYWLILDRQTFLH